MKSFRDSIAFQLATELRVEVYRITKSFPYEERYGLTSQLRRASIGVVAQIAEGAGRLTYGEWRQLLSQARGSLYEIESELIAARKLGYVAEDEMRTLTRAINRAGSALRGLITWVRSRETSKRRNPETSKPNAPPQ